MNAARVFAQVGAIGVGLPVFAAPMMPNQCLFEQGVAGCLPEPDRLQPRLEASGIQLRWQVGELPELAWLTPGNALHVLRILQEVVANILKHAAAGEILLSTSVVAALATWGRRRMGVRSSVAKGAGLTERL